MGFPIELGGTRPATAKLSEIKTKGLRKLRCMEADHLHRLMLQGSRSFTRVRLRRFAIPTPKVSTYLSERHPTLANLRQGSQIGRLPQMTNMAVLKWCQTTGVEWHYIALRCPAGQ